MKATTVYGTTVTILEVRENIAIVIEAGRQETYHLSKLYVGGKSLI